MQTTLIILKPDAGNGVMGRIIARFEDKGLQVVGCKLMQISQNWPPPTGPQVQGLSTPGSSGS